MMHNIPDKKRKGVKPFPKRLVGATEATKLPKILQGQSVFICHPFALFRQLNPVSGLL